MRIILLCCLTQFLGLLHEPLHSWKIKLECTSNIYASWYLSLSLSHFLRISLTSHHFKLYFIHLFYMHNLCVLEKWFFMFYNNDIDTWIELNLYKFNQEINLVLLCLNKLLKSLLLNRYFVVTKVFFFYLCANHIMHIIISFVSWTCQLF